MAEAGPRRSRATDAGPLVDESPRYHFLHAG